MRVILLFVVSALGCSSGVDAMPMFPENYAATYQEVRNCRRSLDHDLMTIRVLASPDAIAPYTGRTLPFGVGAIIVKEQYSDIDTSCAGPVLEYTVMRKTESAPDALDWEWQRVDNERHVLEVDLDRCISCHTSCGKAPEGYDGTCTVP